LRAACCVVVRVKWGCVLWGCACCELCGCACHVGLRVKWHCVLRVVWWCLYVAVLRPTSALLLNGQ
jgi:hypothetical protein